MKITKLKNKIFEIKKMCWGLDWILQKKKISAPKIISIKIS